MKVWIDIDKKWKWIATDEDGEQVLFTHKPSVKFWYWFSGKGCTQWVGCNLKAAKDWKNSLRRLEEIELEDV